MSTYQFGQLEDFFSKLHKGESEPISKKPNKFKKIYDQWMENSFAKFEKSDSSILSSGKFIKKAKKKSLTMPIQCDSEAVLSESPMKSKKKSKKGKKSLNAEECKDSSNLKSLGETDDAVNETKNDDSLFSSPGLGSPLGKKKASKLSKLFDFGNSGMESKKRKLEDSKLDSCDIQTTLEKSSPKKKQKVQLGESHEDNSPSKGDIMFDDSSFAHLSAKKRKKALKLMKLMSESGSLGDEIDLGQNQEEQVENKDDSQILGMNSSPGSQSNEGSSKKKRNKKKKKNSAIFSLNQDVESGGKNADLSISDMDTETTARGDNNINDLSNEDGASGENKRKRKKQKKKKNMGNENVSQNLDQSNISGDNEVKEEDEDEENGVIPEIRSPKKKKMKGSNLVETDDTSTIEIKLSKKQKKLEKKKLKKLGGIVSGLDSEPELTKFKVKSEENDEDNEPESEKEDESEDDQDMDKSSYSRTPNLQKFIPKFDSEEKTKRTVFVGNLPMDINEKTLEDIFKPYGKIESVRLRGAIPKKDSIPKKVANIRHEYSDDATSMKGFVVFKNEEDAEKALSLNGTVFNGHHLRVDKAKSKEQVNQKPQYDNSATLYLGNLPYQVDDETVWDEFGRYGTVTSVRIVRDRETGAGKGFGFVQFEDVAHREAALAADDIEIGGRKLRVKPAEDKPPNDRPPRFQNQQGRDNQQRRSFPFNKFHRNDRQEFGPRKTFRKFNDQRKREFDKKKVASIFSPKAS